MLSIDKLNEIRHRIYIEKTIDVLTVFDDRIDGLVDFYGLLLGPDHFIDLFPRYDFSGHDYFSWNVEDIDYTIRSENIRETRIFTKEEIVSPTIPEIPIKILRMSVSYFHIPSAYKYFKILPNDESDIDVCRVSWSDVMQEESVDLNKPFSVFGDPCVFIRTFLEKYENDFFEIGFSNGKVDFCENKLPEVMCAVEDTVDTKTEYLTIKVSLKP